MAPFKPAGEKARWRIIYDLLEPLQVGGVLTYKEMAEALDLDLNAATSRHTIQMAVQRALKELLEEHHRTCEPVVNVGYRVVEPAHHLTLAEGRQRRARKQIRQGYDIATKVDLTGVDPTVRAALETLALGFSRQMEINRRMERRQRRHSDAIALLQQQVADLQQSREEE